MSPRPSPFEFLIQALARAAVEDYLTLKVPTGKPDGVAAAKPVPLPAMDRAA